VRHYGQSSSIDLPPFQNVKAFRKLLFIFCRVLVKLRFHSSSPTTCVAHLLCNYGAHQPRAHCWCFLSFKRHLVTWSWSIQFPVLLKQSTKTFVHCFPQLWSYVITKHDHSCHLHIIRKLEPRINSNTEKNNNVKQLIPLVFLSSLLSISFSPQYL